MVYDFLVETYQTERIKVLSVWCEFHDGDLSVRPNAADPRGRSVREQMIHQCVSEDLWFRTMLEIDVAAPPLPKARIEAGVYQSLRRRQRQASGAHHRGQQMAMLRVLSRNLHSNYGPTADTGGLMQNHARTIYAYENLDLLLRFEAAGGRKSPFPGDSSKPVTERPDSR